jgi:hypothetical protein
MFYSSLQQIFNRAWHGLKSQEFRQSKWMDDTGVLYCQALDSKSGCRCAIGWLGNPSNGILANDEMNAYLDWRQWFDRSWDDTLSLVNQLVQAHDLATDAENMEHLLRLVALKNGLTVPSVVSMS